jgi:uncharacterized protein YeaO (DUF488 family)
MTTYRREGIYDDLARSDGYRVLVDRLWPRGISKEKAALDEWEKNIAPSTQLREWFGHEPAKFAEFTQRYTDELRHNPAVKEFHERMKQHDRVILLYGAKDKTMNQAVVLEAFLRQMKATAS